MIACVTNTLQNIASVIRIETKNTKNIEAEDTEEEKSPRDVLTNTTKFLRFWLHKICLNLYKKLSILNFKKNFFFFRNSLFAYI